jgi:pyruvate,water dikinase
MFEPADKTWREDPAIPLNALQGYIRLREADDPDVRYKSSIETRERLLVEARKQLASEPSKLARFNELHDMARHYLPITENHNFYIDQIGIAVLRLPLLEIGERLVRKGVAADADSVFMLYRKEIPDAIGGKDVRDLVVHRRVEIARWSKVIPAPEIGEPPPHPDKPDPLGVAFAKMFGLPVEPSRDPQIIAGIGASKGVAQGRAKVVRNLGEASKLQKGDIMVCELTMPPWTPLFSTVSALVADTGGVLSHCAIVSREYGLPAVVGTRIGTAVLKDGMQLTVDGSKGLVRIEARS